MYSLWDYRRMLDDPVRVGAYAQALRESVRPDDVVLDVGCGFGVFTVLAARLGARMAYGIDPNPAVSLAPDVARENGVQSRVRFWRGLTEDVELDPAPTLLVGDVRGVLPFNAGAVAAWNGALRRLAPGARTIPASDVLLAQPIRSETLHRSARVLDDIGGVSLRSLGGPLANGAANRLGDEILLGAAQPLFTIDYGRPLVARWEGEARFALPPGTLVDGVILGFEAHLTSSVTYRSFGPGSATAYGACYLPCPERVVIGDAGQMSLRLRVREGVSHPLMLWAVDVPGAQGEWQSELLGDPIPLDVVRAAQPDHRPAADPDDDLQGALLTAFHRGRSVGEAVEDALAALPDVTDVAKVERRAAELAQRRQARRVRRYGA
jgi:SAM-dependent methyltransferase